MEERMGAAQREVQIRTLDGSTQADPLDFEILDIALGDTEDHVLNQTAGSAVKGTVLSQFAGAGNDDGAVFVGEGDAVRKVEVKFALGAFDDDCAAVEFDGDFFREGDWFETDS
jgi:hypothetical protein